MRRPGNCRGASTARMAARSVPAEGFVSHGTPPTHEHATSPQRGGRHGARSGGPGPGRRRMRRPGDCPGASTARMAARSVPAEGFVSHGTPPPRTSTRRARGGHATVDALQRGHYGLLALMGPAVSAGPSPAVNREAILLSGAHAEAIREPSWPIRSSPPNRSRISSYHGNFIFIQHFFPLHAFLLFSQYAGVLDSKLFMAVLLPALRDSSISGHRRFLLSHLSASPPAKSPAWPRSMINRASSSVIHHESGFKLFTCNY